MRTRPTTVEDLIAGIRDGVGRDCEAHVSALENELRDVMLYGPPWHRVDGYGWHAVTLGWDRPRGWEKG